MPKRPALTAASTIGELAESPLLEKLTRVELAIYLRLLAEAGRQKSKEITPKNAELYNPEGANPKSTAEATAKALRALEGHGLVAIEYDNRRPQSRTIKVR